MWGNSSNSNLSSKLDDLTKGLDDLLDWDAEDVGTSFALTPSTAQSSETSLEESLHDTIEESVNTSDNVSNTQSLNTLKEDTRTKSKTQLLKTQDVEEDTFSLYETQKLLAEIAQEEKKNKQEIVQKRKLFKVKLPKDQGYVTLDYVKGVNLEEVLDYVIKKRNLKPNKSYGFKYDLASINQNQGTNLKSSDGVANNKKANRKSWLLGSGDQLNLTASSEGNSGTNSDAQNSGSEEEFIDDHLPMLATMEELRFEHLELYKVKKSRRETLRKSRASKLFGSILGKSPSEPSYISPGTSPTQHQQDSAINITPRPLTASASATSPPKGNFFKIPSNRKSSILSSSASASANISSHRQHEAPSAKSSRGSVPVFDKCGYLTKEGGSIKTWKRRWCVLKKQRIFYAKEKDASQIDFIELSNLSVDKVCSEPEYKKKKNIFSIDTPRRKFYLQAESEEERESWITSIKQAVTSVVYQPKVEDFQVLHMIGKGGYGKVLQVRQKQTEKIYAMKVLYKRKILDSDPAEIKAVFTEKSILQNLVHPFVVNLYYAFQTEEELLFVMDYINGGDLSYRITQEGQLPLETTVFYAAEIVIGLEYLHSSGVMYRDLKCENILINGDGHVVLTDFGMSKTGVFTENSRSKTICGTAEYLAPEILEEKGYGKAVDFWALGCVIYEMLNGKPPFYHRDRQRVYVKILRDDVEFPEHFNDVTKDLLTKLFYKDPSRRLTNFVTLKEDPFFASINWTQLTNKEVTPPFIPEVKDKTDVSAVDPIFLKERATIEDPGVEGLPITGLGQKPFKDFSYNFGN